MLYHSSASSSFWSNDNPFDNKAPLLFSTFIFMHTDSSTFSGEVMNSLSGTSTHCSLAFVCNFSLGSCLFPFGITSETFTGTPHP